MNEWWLSVYQCVLEEEWSYVEYFVVEKEDAAEAMVSVIGTLPLLAIAAT